MREKEDKDSYKLALEIKDQVKRRRLLSMHMNMNTTNLGNGSRGVRQDNRRGTGVKSSNK